MATTLQLFNIQKKKDSSGQEIEVDGGYTDGFAMYVLTFKSSTLKWSDQDATQ